MKTYLYFPIVFNYLSHYCISICPPPSLFQCCFEDHSICISKHHGQNNFVWGWGGEQFVQVLQCPIKASTLENRQICLKSFVQCCSLKTSLTPVEIIFRQGFTLNSQDLPDLLSVIFLTEVFRKSLIFLQLYLKIQKFLDSGNLLRLIIFDRLFFIFNLLVCYCLGRLRDCRIS